MAKLACAQRLRDVGPCELTRYSGDCVADVLAAAAVEYPRLRAYILDDQGRVRKHVAVFVGGVLRPRGTVLELPVADDDEIYLIQALSGG